MHSTALRPGAQRAAAGRSGGGGGSSRRAAAAPLVGAGGALPSQRRLRRGDAVLSVPAAVADGAEAPSSSSSSAAPPPPPTTAGKGFGKPKPPQQQSKQQSKQQQRGVTDDPLISPKMEAQLSAEQYREIYDRLISIFQARPRDDWKKLIVLSRQWPQHKAGVFDRLRKRADDEEDVDAKMTLRRLFRTLQGVDEEVSRYNNVLAKFLGAEEAEWEAVVATYRGDLQKPFFEHMQCLIAAAKDDAPRKEQLVAINARLLALVTAFDSVAAEPEKLEAAAEVYRDLLSSISSIEEADKKMEELASSGKIDPAFLQITAKAYGAARDTNMTLDEAKWVSYRLYLRARDYFDRQQPREKRILEYLITIRDTAERSRQLDAAVTPGPDKFTDTHDYMWSTPARLYAVLDGTLKAWEAMNNAASERMGAGAESQGVPRKIRAMRELRDEVRRRYL